MKILFVCSGNTCRSPMAEALMRKKCTDRALDVQCSSAGIMAFVGDSATDEAVEVMKDYGIDLSAHRSSKLSHYRIDSSNKIVCMTKGIADVLGSGLGDKVTVLGGGIPDPYGGDIDTYRHCGESIDRALDELIDALSPDTITLRPMKADDIEAVAEIERECFSTPWSEAALGSELSNENAVFTLCDVGGKTVGYGGMHITLDECYIANIAVKADSRKSGYGSKLLSHMTDVAKKRGCSFISLEVRESNIPAIAMYEKQGFEGVGIRKNFYSHPTENALIMTKYFSEES